VDEELNFTHVGDAGRLDKVLHDLLTKLPDYEVISRTQVQEWIEEGNVSLNQKVVFKSSAKISANDKISVVPPAIETRVIPPYEFPLDVLFEDKDLVVINKPAGLTVHPGAGNRDKTLVNALVYRYGASFADISSSDRPGVVHRLDKDTTGVLVVARSEKATKGLIDQFSSRKANRQYLALVRTLPRAEGGLHSANSGSVDANIGRNPVRRTEMAVLPSGGLRAVTNWKVEERFPYGAVVRLSLETGRTHQIRVHMEHLKSPVIGDTTYGNFDMLPQNLLRATKSFNRQALHAETLGFAHPITGEAMKFSSPMPQDMSDLIQTFRSFV
jgi:23S rRNA pseudouridine1911/1915/1917 synthase